MSAAKPAHRAWFRSIRDHAETYPLDEVVYTARDGSLLEVAHDMQELAKTPAAEWKRLFGLEIFEGLGTTEMMFVFVSSAVSRRVKPGAVGPAVPGYEVKVVTEEGGEAKPGEVGLLVARGPTGTLYWRDTERQRAAVWHGWSRVGDFVTVDEDEPTSTDVGQYDDAETTRKHGEELDRAIADARRRLMKDTLPQQHDSRVAPPPRPAAGRPPSIPSSSPASGAGRVHAPPPSSRSSEKRAQSSVPVPPPP